MDNNRCSASVHNDVGVSFHQCFRKAKVTRDGKGFCGIHDPVHVKAKDEKLRAKWKAEDEARRKVRDAKERRQEAGEMAIALARRIVYIITAAPIAAMSVVEDDARAVIDKLVEQ